MTMEAKCPFDILNRNTYIVDEKAIFNLLSVVVIIYNIQLILFKGFQVNDIVA